jgi:hypothetical protein
MIGHRHMTAGPRLGVSAPQQGDGCADTCHAHTELVGEAGWLRAAALAKALAWMSLVWMCAEGALGLWQGFVAGSIACARRAGPRAASGIGPSGYARRVLTQPDGSWVRVTGALVELKGKGLVYGPPKARASLRTNALPEAIRPIIVEHLAKYVANGGDAWVFTGERGNPIRSGNRNLLTGWKQEVVAIGRPGLHFHDLRHKGNTLVAQTYVSTKDLMARMGQDSPRAALIYQHASRQVDQTVDRCGQAERAHLGIDSTAKDPDDEGEGGPAGVLVRSANST